MVLGTQMGYKNFFGNFRDGGEKCDSVQITLALFIQHAHTFRPPIPEIAEKFFVAHLGPQYH